MTLSTWCPTLRGFFQVLFATNVHLYIRHLLLAWKRVGLPPGAETSPWPLMWPLASNSTTAGQPKCQLWYQIQPLSVLFPCSAYPLCDTILGERWTNVYSHHTRSWWQPKGAITPMSNWVNQWVYWGYLVYMDDVLLTGIWLTQRQLHHQKSTLVGDTSQELKFWRFL